MQVNSPRPKTSQLEAISQALGIASNIYGIRTNMAQYDKYKKDLEAQEKLEQGNLSPVQAAELAQKGGSFVPVGSEGGIGQFDIQGEKYSYKPKIETGTSIIDSDIKIEQLKALKNKPGKEDEKVKKQDTKDLIGKVEKIDKEFSPFERLYGSIESLEEKYKSGNLNPQDRVQLIRLIVPLTEINPGVVRSEEINLVNQQQSIIDSIQAKFGKATRGEAIPENVVSDIFNTVKSLKPVVANIKYDSINKVKEQANYYGLGDKMNLILGEKNQKLLSNPENFASFTKPKMEKNKAKVDLKAMSDEDLENKIKEAAMKAENKSMIGQPGRMR